VIDAQGLHVQHLAWHADQRRFLSCGGDVRLWDSETGECLKVYRGHKDTVRSVVWSPDQHYVLSASHDRSVRIWESGKERSIHILEGHGQCVVNAVWTLDGKGILSCDSSGGLRSWALDDLLAPQRSSPVDG
jgi:WD40 repeat protein